IFSLGMLLVGALIIDRVAERMIHLFYPAFMLLRQALYFTGSPLIALWYGIPDGHFVPRGMRWIAIVWIPLQFGYSFLPSSWLNFGTWPGLYYAVCKGSIVFKTALSACWAKYISQRIWRFIQKSADMLKNFAKRKAVLGVTLRRPFTISLTRW